VWIGRKGEYMKTKGSLSLMLVAVLVALPLFTVPIQAQDPQPVQATALMRGYRTGYSDGYPSGRLDAARQGDNNPQAKPEYQQANRAYVPTFGDLEEYRNGYRQGFESGYRAGYEGKSFDSTIPDDLKIREQNDATASAPVANPSDPVANTSDPVVNKSDNTSDPNSDANNANNAGPLAIPRDTILTVELLSNLATDVSQKGDRFEARVIEPKDYEGAIVEGQVEGVKRPGKAKGTAELQLSFERIRLTDGRSGKMSAQVIEVLPQGGSQGVGKVDSEGGVKGQSSTKNDIKKVGISTGVGALIGAIFGGGSGAAIGASIGAGVGTAGVLRERGKDIYLYHGQHLRIRTNSNIDVP
jgi:hypothetical protein